MMSEPATDGVDHEEVVLASHPAPQPPTAVADAAQQILQVPGNSVCCDCSRPAPTWASTNLGAVMCIQCSGVHRRIGAHISKVLSLTLDDWDEDSVEGMLAAGNDKVNAMYEHSLPEHVSKPEPESSMDLKSQYVESKYSLKSFVEGGSGVLVEKKEGGSGSTVGQLEYIGILFVRVISGKVDQADALSESDPYAVAKLGTQTMTTKTIQNNNEPEWNETLMLNVPSLREPLSIHVFDSDCTKKDDLLGEATVDLSVLEAGKPLVVRAELQNRKGDACCCCCSKASTKPSFVKLELTFNQLE